MTHVILRVIDGRYCCGRTTNGLDWEPEGCAHATPREASRHAERVQRGLYWQSAVLVSSSRESGDGDER